MARKLKPATPADIEKIEQALALLRQARGLLAQAGAARTVERVRLAITSADGARRHAEHRTLGTNRAKPRAVAPSHPRPLRTLAEAMKDWAAVRALE